MKITPKFMSFFCCMVSETKPFPVSKQQATILYRGSSYKQPIQQLPKRKWPLNFKLRPSKRHLTKLTASFVTVWGNIVLRLSTGDRHLGVCRLGTEGTLLSLCTGCSSAAEGAVVTKLCRYICPVIPPKLQNVWGQTPKAEGHILCFDWLPYCDLGLNGVTLYLIRKRHSQRILLQV